ncbi:hypothetical protein B1H10_06100 [candidate division KSB1 bacterium 4484_188]|nr:MAG: hypothetical protein B1H10_06100 [candidate division KSB1 bacterium 4484_188]HFE63261.1 hypothetical protein [Caldithrix sp.]
MRKIVISLLLSILFCPRFLLPATGTGGQPGAHRKNPADSLQTRLKLPNPFLKESPFQLWVSPSQQLRDWVFLNRSHFWSEISLPKTAPSQNFGAIPRIDWTLATPGHVYRGLDFRESSLFVPTNVREYLDYKMGRSRILPVATLAAAGYLAHLIYQRYGYLLAKREQEKYRDLRLNRQEITLMKILWKQQGLTATQWYTHYNRTGSDRRTTFLILKKTFEELEGKYLIRSRILPDGQVKYVPAISKTELLIKLKEMQSYLDGKQNPNRLREIQFIIEQLED